MACPDRSFRGLFVVLALSGAFAVPDALAAAPDPLLVSRAEQQISGGDSAGGFAAINAALRAPDTTDELRADLLGELARLRSGRGEHRAAGDALAERAETVARLDGAESPDLAGIYAAAADAYAAGNAWTDAVAMARRALDADAAYNPCSSEIVTKDHARLADLLGRAGQADEAADERRLAEMEPGLRCSLQRTSRGAPPVVAENDIGDADKTRFATIRVCYATDRARTGSDRPNDFYGSDRGPMEYGTMDITVPREHKPGAVEAPSLVKLEWSENPERHFVISRLATRSEDEMFADIHELMAGHGSDEALVFVHGYNVTFANAAKRAAQITYDLNFDGAPILFSWPSVGSAFSYIRDEAVVRLSGRHLLHLLEDVLARSGAKKVNIVAHSMGNRALIDALSIMAARRQGAGQTGPIFGQIIFAAPDEDAAMFADVMSTLRPLAERLTLYGSDQDLALDASRSIHGDLPRAGQAGPGIVVTKDLDSIDMSALGNDILAHGYFANTSSALTDMLWLFWRDTPPGARCGLDARDGPAGRSWIYQPAKCDGAAMLSALTLLKQHGRAALTRLQELLTGSGSPPDVAAAEYREISDALSKLAAAPGVSP
jgi:esterase/lipase superfamily enzyme